MPLDPNRLLTMPPIETRQRFTRRDTILYALGIGAEELPFVYEDRLQALPTMATILGNPGFFWQDPPFGVDWRRIVHGEIGVELYAPLPVEGEAVGLTSFGPIFDKGADKGAIVYQTRRVLVSGETVATIRSASFLRGDGGFGGSAEGQPAPQAIPDRPCDHVCILPTATNQALLYRLSGDPNPLHVDPAAAQASGFDRPILHGLATFGFAGRALLAALADNQPDRILAIEGRFSAPVYPGETIETEIWRLDDEVAAFRSRARERGVIVFNNGRLRLAPPKLAKEMR